MKTGSTFLQRQVIPKLGINHFNDPKHVGPGPSQFLRPVLSMKWDKKAAAQIKAQTLSLFEAQAGAESDSEKTLLSWEGMVGDPFLGFLNQDRLADLVQDMFADAQILITLRRQDDFAESLYVQTIHNYRWGGVDDFLIRDGHSFGPFKFSSWRANPQLSVFDLDWNELVNLYTERFGVDNVLVLPYEFLVENPLGFVEEWCKFIDCDMPDDIDLKHENRSYSKISFAVARTLNRFVCQKGSLFCFIVNRPFGDRLLPHISHNRAARIAYGILRRIDLRRILQEYVDRIFLTPARPFDGGLKKAILDLHKDGNKKLSQRTGLKLEKYGYF